MAEWWGGQVDSRPRRRTGAISVLASSPSRVVHVREDPVGFWLGRLGEGSRKSCECDFRKFMAWLNGRAGWVGVSPRDLLLRQREARMGLRDEFEVVDLLHEFLVERKLAKNSNRHTHSAVRGFFRHNRLALPDDPDWKIPSAKPPTIPRLGMSQLIQLINYAGLRDRSWMLVKWMGLLDNEGTIYICNTPTVADHIVTAMQEGVCPIRLDIPGRKGTENEKNFFTYMGKDAIDALKKYFEHERGWPQKGEPLWLNKYGEPFTITALTHGWLKMTRQIGFVPEKRGSSTGTRYGYNTHEMRDIARSHLHLKAKADGFDLDCAEYFMGHTSTLDPLKYDRFYEDEAYMLEQYRIAETHLNIISNPPVTTEEVKRQKQELEDLRLQVADANRLHAEVAELRQALQEVLDKRVSVA